MRQVKTLAFTLAEVLIALALLGIVAAFAIPKVLQSTGDQRRIAVSKEAIATVSEAYQQYLAAHNGETDANMTLQDLLPYLNHLGLDTTSQIDNRFGGVLPSLQCSPPAALTTGGTPECLRMPSGVMLVFYSNICFGGLTSEYVIPYQIDSDGRSSGVNDNLSVYLHINGKTTLQDQVGQVSYIDSCAVRNTHMVGEPNPPWFNW